MQKNGKRKIYVKALSLLLAFAFIFGAGFAAGGRDVQAASSVYVVSKARCGVGMRYSSTVTVNLVASTDTIKNIKVYSGTKGSKKTSNLVVKRTYQYKSSYRPYADLTFYAKKAGTYRIKFDVYKSSKSKRTSRTVTVFASGYGSSISKVTLDKTTATSSAANMSSYYTTKSSAKVKFTMAKGLKIKKITASYLDQNGKVKTKTFKNGSKITFGKYGSSSDTDYIWQRGMFAYTHFVISYTDSYAQDDSAVYTAYYTIYTKASKWY